MLTVFIYFGPAISRHAVVFGPSYSANPSKSREYIQITMTESTGLN